MIGSDHRRAVMALITILSSTLRVGVAQTPQHDSAFVATAKRAAAKYRSQDAAVADGFRPVGVEFPAMGEHWVSLQRVMANTVDPAQPSVLIYVTVKGQPMLGGVAYTRLLRPGEPLPRSPGSGHWHEHNGSVADESFPLRHGMGQESSATSGDSIRLAILHLWTEIPNDAGPFSTDNWRLPLRRLGMPVRLQTADALQTIALAQDETGYFALMLRVALHPTDREESISQRILSGARAAAIEQVAALRAVSASGRASESMNDRALADVWEDLWRALDERLPSRRAQLSVLRRELDGGSGPMSQMRGERKLPPTP
jgi:hypothetical protein